MKYFLTKYSFDEMLFTRKHYGNKNGANKKLILFCWQKARLVNVELQLGVELEGDKNLKLIANNGIFDILDKIGKD